ncbi:MAG TPA: FtsX-like permease family protein, partial [Longimicrobiales bacterium]|nr:FtsX-like permease family protein [Longimicrobiales bacterium]
TLVLLVTATLLGRSFMRLLAIDPGFRTQDLLILDLAFDPVSDPAEAASLAHFQETLLARLRSLPGVRAVGGVNDFPLGGGSYSNGQFLEMTRPDEIKTYDDVMRLTDLKERAGYAGYRVASAGYFRAMNIPLIRGRLFEPGDGPDAPHVAVISQSLADAKWPNQDPIGRFVQFGNMDGDVRGFRIVGVVGDVRESSPEAIPVPLFYGNHVQRVSAATSFSLVLQGSLPASTAIEAQQIVRQMNPDLPVRVRTVEEALEQALAGRRFSLLLGMVFGVSALVLASLGIYGVVSYLVAQRQRELGIRLALGASRASMLQLVVGKGMLLAMLGTAIGVAASLILTRSVASLLYGVSPTDPVTFAVVVATVVGCVLVATSLPALRAARIAPSISLRTE